MKNLMPFQSRSNRQRVFSSFELWPSWIFYTPLAIHWLSLGLKYKSLTLPSLANPCITTGGICGESKSSVLALAHQRSADFIAPFITFQNGKHAFKRAHSLIEHSGLKFPLVLKPDIGCRGAGVRKVNTLEELEKFLPEYPGNSTLILQKLVDRPFEAGVFYIRHPNETNGRITSITIKQEPVLTGDGHSTLLELLQADPRMRKLKNLYLPKIKGREDEVLAKDTKLPLVFSGNHCRGSIFKNGAALHTTSLEAKLDEILKSLPEFHYGRIDLKASSKESLMACRNFEIIEINGVGSEPTHIWDKNAKIIPSYKSYFSHWKEMFQIGDEMRSRGWTPISLRKLFAIWIKQRSLMSRYPDNN